MSRLWLIAVLVTLVSGCGQQQKQLRLLNWSDYMPQEVLAEFEKREGVKVVEDTYDSPEAMLSKLQAGGDSEYDVLITADYTIGSLARAGSLLELDKSKIPNLKNLDPQFADPAFDPGGKYSVVYQWGTTGLAYREDLDRAMALMHEVANGLLARARPPVMGVIPVGTGNDFARALGLPRDPAAAAGMLLRARPKLLDVGVVNDRHYLTVAGAGFDGEVARLVNAWPKVLGGTAMYVLGILKMLMAYRPVEVDLVIDGIPERERLFLIAVGNTAWNAGAPGGACGA